MRQLLLHIGQAKTGTTTLQSTFLASRKALLTKGVLYPKTVWGNNHRIAKVHFGGLSAAPIADRKRYNGNATELLKDGTRAWKRILSDIEKNDPDMAIISAEAFFTMPRHEGFSDFVEELNGLADEVKVVAYVRSPSAHYLSLNQQGLKHLRLNRPPNQGAFYRDSLEPYLKAFGDKLNVHKFDRSKLIDGDIIKDFTSRYLPEDAAAVLQVPTPDANSSISAEAMTLFEEICSGTAPPQYAEYGRSKQISPKKVVAIDDELPGKTRPKFRPGIARIIHDTSSDLDWVRDTFGIVFDAPDTHPDADGLSAKERIEVRSLCHVDESRLEELWERTARATNVAALRNPVAKFMGPEKPVRDINNGRWGPLGWAKHLLRLSIWYIRHNTIARRLRRRLKMLF